MSMSSISMATMDSSSTTRTCSPEFALAASVFFLFFIGICPDRLFRSYTDDRDYSGSGEATALAVEAVAQASNMSRLADNVEGNAMVATPAGAWLKAT